MIKSGDFTGARWRKASHSGTSGECVELVHTETVFGVRDSKNADGPVLALTAEHGFALLNAIRNDGLAWS
jgi:hypothetical protein